MSLWRATGTDAQGFALKDRGAGFKPPLPIPRLSEGRIVQLELASVRVDAKRRSL